nr:phospholipase D beta 1-like [Tanacetum cinerariifolium]
MQPYTPRCIQNFRKAKDHDIKFYCSNDIKSKIKILDHKHAEGTAKNSQDNKVLRRELQHQTMQMMYDVIYKALQEMWLEIECEPQDYLNFFCLGTRVSSQKTQPTTNGKVSVAPNTPRALSIASRRFMIHVNSKGMIVDDKFGMLGSANINQCPLEARKPRLREKDVVIGRAELGTACSQ